MVGVRGKGGGGRELTPLDIYNPCRVCSTTFSMMHSVTGIDIIGGKPPRLEFAQGPLP